MYYLVTNGDHLVKDYESKTREYVLKTFKTERSAIAYATKRIKEAAEKQKRLIFYQVFKCECQVKASLSGIEVIR